MKCKRADIQNVINKEENEKQVLEKHVKALLDKLNVLNKNLEKHVNTRENYDRTIHETESGFKKVFNIILFLSWLCIARCQL